MMETFVKRTRIAAPAEEVFFWHEKPGALERLTPPWEKAEVVERTGGLQPGARVKLRVRWGPFTREWVAEHREYQAGRMFRDVMVDGPFALWDHRHIFQPDGESACWLEDRIEYELPWGWLGRVLGGWFARRKIEKLFEYRHRVTGEAFHGWRK